MRTTTRPKTGFFIGVTCPGCGADLELQSDFFVLECAHCGSVLRIIMPEAPPAYVVVGAKDSREIRFHLDRYLKTGGLPLTGPGYSIRRIFYPYWKTDAILLKVKEKHQVSPPASTSMLTSNVSYGDLFDLGNMVSDTISQSSGEAIIEHSVEASLTPYMVTTAAGPTIDGLPSDLGLRAEYVGMRPFKSDAVSPDDEFHPVTVRWKDTLARISKSMSLNRMSYSGSERTLQKQIFRPRCSVIYFPFFICETGSGSGARRYVIDGLSGRVLSSADDDSDEDSASSDSTPATEFGELTVTFHRCPTCGVDLPPTRSCVYICHNCQSVVALDQGEAPRGGIRLAQGENVGGDTMFPFWLLTLSDYEVGRIAKSSALAGAPDVLVVPAFRMSNFGEMRKLCQRITCAMPNIPTMPAESYSRNFLPVEIGISEAVTLADVCLYCEDVTKRSELSPDEVALSPRDVGLVFVPFRPQSYFYVDSIINAVTFAKSSAPH
jgi:DNA-directed RNA polymerase subunit RPC12/RpoP